MHTSSSLRDHRGEIPGKLQAHKNSVLRSRVEARERVAHMASLESEVERLRALLKETEGELSGRRCLFCFLKHKLTF